MQIETGNIVSVTEANQNFSKVSRIADAKGQVVIFKNNRPKYLMVDLEKNPPIEMTESEKIDFVAARILREHRKLFEGLAK